jgi:hypothetical protein
MFGIHIKSYKNKFLLLAGSFVLSMIFIYKLSIVSTIEQITIHNQLQKDLQFADELSGFPSDMNQIQVAATDSLSLYELLLFEMINSVISGQQVHIIEYSNDTKDQKNGLLMVTHTIELSGKYPALIKSLHQLEQRTSHFNLSSVAFSKTKNMRTRKLELILKLHYQILTNNENNI